MNPYTVNVFGEGEFVVMAASVKDAERMADEVIAAGDYDLARGEEVTVRYSIADGTGRSEFTIVVEG